MQNWTCTMIKSTRVPRDVWVWVQIMCDIVSMSREVTYNVWSRKYEKRRLSPSTLDIQSTPCLLIFNGI